MSSTTTVPPREHDGVAPSRPTPNRHRPSFGSAPLRHVAQMSDIDAPHRQAELFYLQKQIQSQTSMVFVLEDGEHVEGCIEWYDRNCIKVRGKGRTLIYKAAIKYLYKQGDTGQV